MDFAIVGATLAGPSETTPFLLNWSRLEALPVTPDLEQGLQACVADPLWMLGRQWQFSEFQGEDAGTPIDARFELEYAALDRIRLGSAGKGARDFQPLARPLEVVVEAEAEPRICLRLSAEAGLQCLRRLRAAALPDAASAVQSAFPLASASTDPTSDSTGSAWQRILDGRATDGVAIAGALTPFLNADGSLSGLPPVAGIDPAGPDVSAIRKVLATWLAEYRDAFGAGVPGESAWLPDRQEYAFAARAKLTDGTRVLLDAQEYTDGRLDWYSFALKDDPGLGEPAAAVPAGILAPSPKLPAPVRYPGMPADRYWEFEDSKVSFGRAAAGPTELMRMLLIDFALVYGNDWFYVPFDLPVGSLCSIVSLKVRDTFGVETSVQPARNLDGQRCRLFDLSSTGAAEARSWFFLAPALPARLQGDPIEELALFRDEMANMAWGVERRIASPVAGSIDRALETYSSILHQDIDSQDIAAELVYRLQTDVPDRWIPLLPVTESILGGGPSAFTHVLERRTMIRTVPDGLGGTTRLTIHPRGVLLRTDPSLPVDGEPALQIKEEEVPREGAIVKRAYQYTRWLDGTSHLWLGRDKTTGRGEGSSGLRFDLLIRNAGGS